MKNYTKTLFAAAAMTFALGANAAVVTVTSNTALDIENFDGDLAIAKFNTTLGTLTSVKFELFNTISGSIDAGNEGPTSGDFIVTAGGEIDGDVLGSSLAVSNSTTKTFTLGAGETGTVAFAPWTVSNSLTLSSAAALNAFKGPGTFHALLTGWSTSDSEITGNGSAVAFVQLDGYAKVTYTYDIAPVPEPETYAMMLAGLGLVGAIARRRKSA